MAQSIVLLTILLLPATELFADQSCLSVSGLTQAEKRQLEWAQVSKVVDGDTLRLTDGRKVRVIGINSPELGYSSSERDQPSEPFARAAKRHTQTWLENSAVQLLAGKEPQDRHGRLLAHVFNDQGQNLEAELLNQGLAYHVAVPPNLRWAGCFATLEKQAAAQQLGVWQQSQSRSEKPETGYQRITGTVKSIKFGRSWWVSFTDDHLAGFVAVIHPRSQQHINRADIQDWSGKTITVEGWVYASSYRGKPQRRLNLDTPYAWTVH